MDSRFSTAFSALTKPAEVCLLAVLLLAFTISGCAAQSSGPRQIEMLPRDSNNVSHGIISTYAFPNTSRIMIEIDRRIYMGTAERTAPNDTFGLVIAYGPNTRAAGTPMPLGLTNYYRAILSSSDHHVLRCDFIGDDLSQRDGLCIDNFGRLYDLVSSQ